MNVTQAILETARHFREQGNLSPSHCDVRCMVNDLTADNPEIVRKGYDQDRSHKRVLSLLRKASSLD